MALDPISSVVDLINNVGGKVIDRLWPDPAQAAEAKLKLVEAANSKELQEEVMQNDLIKGQQAINLEEAKNPSLFVAGWRPAIGWVGATSLFVYYVPYCLTATYIWAHQCLTTGVLASRPDLGISDLIGLLLAILGVGSMRTFEKVKGVDTTAIGNNK